MCDYMEKERAKFEGFMAQLETEIPYEHLAQKFKIWLLNASNWYSIPSDIKIKILFEMPFEEYPSQLAARSILLDALTGRQFFIEYGNLMPHLFLHWKDELLKEIDEDKRSIVQKANQLFDVVPQELNYKVLEILDKLIKKVHPDLKLVWQPEIDEHFRKFIQQRVKEANRKLTTAEQTIKNTKMVLQGLEKSKYDVSRKIEESKKTLATAIEEKATAKGEIDGIPNDASQLLREEYEDFRNLFFHKRDVSQCVEPVFARVLGHDRFFSVFISNEPATAPIIIGDPSSPHSQRFQLGNRIPQDVIAPCNNRCQYHALGHLYTGDMMLHQSADRLDSMRSVHGLGNVPDQLMSINDTQSFFSMTPPVSKQEKYRSSTKFDFISKNRTTTGEEAIQESLKMAVTSGNVGPREIAGWELKDVLDLGNCFYDAVAHQMEILGHDFLEEVPEKTLPRDSLRLHIQGISFKDQEWADDKQFAELVKKVSAILAVIDTRTPENGYTYYFVDNDGEAITKHPYDEEVMLPADKPIFKLAATGNHFLSVVREKIIG